MRDGSSAAQRANYEQGFMLDCFYLWVDEQATVFCPICVTEPEMGDECLCGEVAA